MKITTLIVLSYFLSNAFSSSAQTTQSTSSPGVIMLQAKGVENPPLPAVKSNPVRTVSDWNLAECDQALQHIDEKVRDLSTDEPDYASLLIYYQEEREKIVQHKESLIQQLKK